MLSNSKEVAMTYTKEPYLICSSKDPPESVFFIPDGDLPALTIKNCDPLSLVTPQQIFKLKKKYRTPNSLIKKIQQCYKNNNDEFDLNEDMTLENSLFINSIEDIILNVLKKSYRNEGASFLPHYPREQMGVRTFHTQVLGSSSSGKSYTTALILADSFHDCVIYIFSPTAKSDPAWTGLAKKLGKRVKLVPSNEVDVDIPLQEIQGGSCCVFDDMDAVKGASRVFIERLQARLLFEGRHHTDKNGIGCCVFSVVHDAFQINSPGLKSSVVESCRVLCFPNQNRSICQKYWQKRLHWSSKEIKEVMSFIKSTDRWCMVYTHVPNLIVCPHGVKLLN